MEIADLYPRIIEPALGHDSTLNLDLDYVGKSVTFTIKTPTCEVSKRVRLSVVHDYPEYPEHLIRRMVDEIVAYLNNKPG